VVGSTESQLVRQFLSESVLTAFTALILAVVIAWFALPALNSVAGTNLTFLSGHTGLLAIAAVCLVLISGLLAGIYPAFALSRFKPISVLKGSFHTSRSGRIVRVGLVVFQFALSIALIGTTGMVQKQLRFIQERDMGYDREQVLLFDMLDGSMAQNQQAFLDELEGHSAFTSIAASGNVPGRTFNRTGLSPEGASEDDIWIWSSMNAAPETLPALGIEFAEGRNFEEGRAADQSGVVLINETAVAQLGWDDPLDRRIFFGPQDSTGSRVIGVVKDFNFAGIHQNIEPLVITPLGSSPGGTVVARVEPGRIPDAISAAEAAWHSVYPDYPYTYSFLDEEFQQIYERDRVTGRIVNIFSALAILIACLGLFGLASYSTTQRVKEIGVRKALGASSPSVMKLLVLDFARWVVVANLFAWPLAWMAASKWLDGFAYRVEIDWMLLVGASLIAFAIAVLTVVSQSWSAARMNPAVALRYE
jgi:putative ABC transport system permease protein